MFGPINNYPRGEETAPVLAGPADAARVVRLSVSPDDRQALVLLLCGPDHRLVLAIVVEGAAVTSVRPAVDLVLEVAEPGGITGLVVGIVRTRGGRLSKAEVRALSGLVAHCDAAGVDLLDVLIVGRRRWRSIWNLAEAPAQDEDDDQ